MIVDKKKNSMRFKEIQINFWEFNLSSEKFCLLVKLNLNMLDYFNPFMPSGNKRP